MDLVTRFLTDRRDKLLMRLGCWLVCFSLVLGLMLPQQRAYAVEPLTITAVASVAAAYLGACGLSFVTQGMDKDALVNSVQRLIQEFLDTELGGVSIQDWLGGVWDVAVIAGKLIMGRPLTDEFVGFAQWVAQKYGTQVGVNQVFYETGDYVTLQDGTKFYLSVTDGSKIISLASSFSYSDLPLIFTSGYYFSARFYDDYGYVGLGLYSSDGNEINASGGYAPLYLSVYNSRLYVIFSRFSVPIGYADLKTDSVFDVVSVNESLSVERKKEGLIFVPPALAAGQGIALDVGAATTMDLDLVLQGVLDDVIAGDLESTMTAADEAVEPIDPPAGEITDVDELGLPALGAALTSRFPFSIPWDFMRAVQLLAAPAKVPYFEVDFLAPMEHRVGKWQGDTTVVLDFSQYAIIGQVCRWTSTIGFCLMLAGVTKRLIWTA